MDKNDEALRETIKKLWPIQAKKMHFLLVPLNEGRIYFKVLFLMNWMSTHE